MHKLSVLKNRRLTSTNVMLMLKLSLETAAERREMSSQAAGGAIRFNNDKGNSVGNCEASGVAAKNSLS